MPSSADNAAVVVSKSDPDKEFRAHLLKETTGLRQLYDEPDEERGWVVDGLIDECSLNLLVAAPKVGKSTTARCLAYQVATSGVFLGRQCGQGSVIYLALEDRPPDIRDHFRALGATGDEPIRFVFPKRGTDIGYLVSKLAEEFRPSLIIIDTLQRFINAEDLNNYAEVTRLMTPLLELSTHAAVLCVHHANKGFRGGVDSVLGSQALSGTVANVFYMKKFNRYRVFGSDQRIGQSLDDITVEYDPQTRNVTAGSSQQTAEINAVADELIAAMEPGARYTRSELSELISSRKQTTNAAVRVLVDSCRIVRTGTGKKNAPYVYETSVAGSVVPLTGREPPFIHTAIKQNAMNSNEKGSSQVPVVPGTSVTSRNQISANPVIETKSLVPKCSS